MSDLRPLGRIVQHDPRSKRYPFKADRAASYGPVKWALVDLDQGQLGSCVGNSGVEVCSAPAFGQKPNEAKAVELYSAATQVDDIPGSYKPDDTGTSGVAAAKVLQKWGWISGYQHAFRIADMLAALQKTPLMVGINWLSSFDKPGTDGRISIAANAYVRGGHELSVDEYDPDKGLVWLHNHWGTGWGVHGRCSISVADLSSLLDQQGDVTVLVPPTQPAPTPIPTPATSIHLDQDIATRVDQLAARAKLTDEQWVNRNLRHYLHLN